MCKEQYTNIPNMMDTLLSLANENSHTFCVIKKMCSPASQGGASRGESSSTDQSSRNCRKCDETGADAEGEKDPAPIACAMRIHHC